MIYAPIALFTYNICYIIYQIGVDNMVKNYSLQNLIDYVISGEEKIKTYINNCGIAFSIVIGVVNLCLSFGLKDIMIAVMNLLIYIGCTVYYYNIEEIVIKYFGKNGDGIIDIIMIVLSALTVGLLLFMYKTDTFKK